MVLVQANGIVRRRSTSATIVGRVMVGGGWQAESQDGWRGEVRKFRREAVEDLLAHENEMIARLS